ncbi:uncharacterized protein F5891DRAFT_963169 [Suillus fuscotomentosus]|uniref:Uncharacterized protein n=1 Tax=Suillus fuscotomentosus TaxID=1912939 RepID=A0AAD4DSU6_9AGAM|nr:uncharacterized protein F5891DRAFT_963169 [Suillus fuscotomentosus]KAG1893316.1 hypothetical protein F5891DRAFT_963169 [Suillus fuscotomentosus]
MFQIDPALGGCDLDDVLMDGNEDIIPAVKGRRHDATNDILREGFVKMERLVHELSRQTSIPTHQVISLWHKSHARGVNSVNHWNAYSGYFKDNLKQELDRLGGKAPDVPGTPSATVRRNCYELFKAAYLDTWQTILEYHGQSVLLSGVPQTVAMCAQEFQKFFKKIVAVVRTSQLVVS